MHNVPAPSPEIRQAAAELPVVVVQRTTEAGHPRGPGVAQQHLVCIRCDQSVLCLDPGTGPYVYTEADMTAAKVRHVREVHATPGGIPLT